MERTIRYRCMLWANGVERFTSMFLRDIILCYRQQINKNKNKKQAMVPIGLGVPPHVINFSSHLAIATIILGWAHLSNIIHTQIGATRRIILFVKLASITITIRPIGCVARAWRGWFGCGCSWRLRCGWRVCWIMSRWCNWRSRVCCWR